MSVARWLETDSLSNQNIAAAAVIGAYTADADRMIVCDVSLDQVAGGGDYVIYITRQINGAGSAYVLLPKTTCAAASGETAIAMQSGPITVRSGDVLTVMVDGLAGDTATPDTTVRWFEMATLRPATADRQLTVAATGEASANVTHHAGVAVAAADANGNVPVVLYPTQGAVTFGQVKILADINYEGALHIDNNALNGVGLFAHGTLIGQHNHGNQAAQYNQGGTYGQYNYGEDAGQYNYGENAGQYNEGDIPVIGVASQGIADALKLAPAAGTPATGSVYDLLGDAALEATAQAILEDTGTTLPALIGGLSGATVTVVSSVAGGTVTVYVADTWRFTVASDQLALADYETLGLIVKRSARQADTQALLYLRTDTGLVRMDGAAPVSAGNGVLTKTATSFTAVVHVAETQGLAPGGYRWWLKGLDTTPAPDEAMTLATGEFVVLAAGLQAVV